TAKVDNAPETDLVITLNNGEQITIKAGDLSGTVTFKNVYADDVYKQGDRALDLSISNTTGGNYEEIDTSSTKTIIVKDDKDVTKVSITTTKKISYEIENIEANKTTDKTGQVGKLSYYLGERHDEYKVYTTSFYDENGVYTNKVPTEILEKLPKISISLLENEIKDENGKKYYSLVVDILDRPIDEKVLINLDNGNIIVFEVGETTKTIKIYDESLTKNIKEDVYSSGVSLGKAVSIKYESMKYYVREYNGTLSVREDMEIDTTQVNLTSEIVGDKIVFTVTTSNPPYYKDKNDEWVARLKINGVFLKNYQIILDKDGKGTLALDIDSITKNGKIDTTVSLSNFNPKGYIGFEDITYGNSNVSINKEVTYEIETSNIPDPTKYDFINTFPTATVEVQKDSTKETYTINLDKNGKGTLTLDTTNLAKEPIFKVVEVNGNFESVDLFNINHKENQTEIIGKTTTITPTKIELTGSEVIEGENITVTATVDNAPQTDLVITLSNNEIITIKAGELTGTIAFKNPYADDIYKQGDRALDISISKTTGGEYKILDTNAKAKVIVKDDADVTNVSVSKIIIPETIDIESSSKTTQNTGKSDEAYFSKWKNNKPSLALNKFKPTGQNVVNDEDLTVKDFYIKDGEVKRDSLGNMFVEIVLVLKNPAKYDMEFSVDQKSYFTIKAGETTGTTKYDYFAKNVPDDVYKQGATFVNFGIDLEKVDGKQIVLRDYFNTNVSKTLIDNEIINFEAEFKGDGYIDTTTANLDYKDNLDGTVTIKIELSNPTKLMSDVYYGYIDVLINGKIERIELSKEQEYFLTVDKQFKDGKFNVGIQKVFSMYEDVSHASTITIEEGYQKFEIETSNIPDPTKYDFVNTFPTAKIEVEKDSTKETYTINLDKNGKGAITLDTTGLTKEPIIKVVEVDGNFEEINVFDKKSLNLNMNFEDDNIDLSNLSAIIEDNQLNLKNGVENKLLNISLEDVLKLAPEKSITIHGDEFDKVSFKNTLASDGTQNNWSKTAGTGTDSGYDVYTNSGDELLKVKVEQPISDGITS
ncbi:hypothetical protein O8C76_10495, partial [Aliarcobacter butzleri]